MCYYLKKLPTFQRFPLSFLFVNKILWFNNLKTRTAMEAKMLVFVICVEAILYFILYNLHDCTINLKPLLYLMLYMINSIS